MILYHGSNQIVEKIDLSKSKPNKDFGRAFYLSESRSQAEEMAEFKVLTFGGGAVVNAFEFNDDVLNVKELKVKRFEHYCEEWAHFVFQNRDTKCLQNIHHFDIVYGPIANDRVGRQISNLKDGYIDFKEFMNRLKYMKGETFQWAFCTTAAISKLRKL